MAWVTREIENITKQKLIDELEGAGGDEKFGLYTTARKHLIEEILPEIRRILPEHTDHGIPHIENVLDNARKLLGDDVENLSGTDLYCLILSILFHDVGNVFGRRDHQRKVGEIYNFVRPGIEWKQDENGIILAAAAAHCGKATDGSKNTLKEISEYSHMDGQPIKLREIAAILRFADELAEGPQRTSRFMQQQHKYRSSSKIFHEYAQATNICIDRGNQRIVATYSIFFEIGRTGKLTVKSKKSISDLLKFIYKRIIKLNQERQYARHYCNLLSPFKKTSVVFNFYANRELLNLDLEEVDITDLVVPEDEQKPFTDYNSEYELNNIIRNISGNLPARRSR